MYLSNSLSVLASHSSSRGNSESMTGPSSGMMSVVTMDLLLCEKAFAAASLVTTHPPSAAAADASAAAPTRSCAGPPPPLLYVSGATVCKYVSGAALIEAADHAENVAMAPEERERAGKKQNVSEGKRDRGGQRKRE